MTEAMPFLQKAILLSYDLRPLQQGCFLSAMEQSLEQLVCCDYDGFQKLK